MFLSRTEEMHYLNRYYEQPDSSLVVLYGQKEIGLTSLWREFAKGKPTILLSAQMCSERQQCYLWAKSVKEQGYPVKGDYPSFGEIFESLLEKARESKLLLVIEDFQNAVRSSDAFADDLFTFIRENRMDDSVMCLLCSHHVGFVENTFVSKVGKNAFSISGFLKLPSLKFLDLVCFYNTKDTLKCMDFYTILGGNPGNWQYFDTKLSLKENIIRTFLKREGKFHEAGLDALQSFLREPAVYSSILFSLSEGICKLNDLYVHTGFSRAKISVYLKNLIHLELVEKVYSFETSGDGNTKKGVYRISDPLVCFWYKFIYPHWEKLSLMDAEEFYDAFIEPEMHDYLHAGYDRIVTEYMCLLNSKKMLPIEFVKYGEWVGKNGTIQFVARDSERNIITGYCVFDKDIMTFSDYEWYQYCLKQARLMADYSYFFSLNGFDDKLKKLAEEETSIKLIEIKDL